MASARAQGPLVTERLVVGISGASGAIFGIRLLELLQRAPIETHLVLSRSAVMTILAETGYTIKQVHDIADVVHKVQDVGAAISSGSFRTMGMIVVPCSMRSLSEIAHGNTTTLLTRAADVVLKERRRLVLAVRETPLHLGHLRAMVKATEIGAIVAPLMPAFYHRPKTLHDLIDHSVGRLLDLFNINSGVVKRWGGVSRQPK